MGTVALEDNIKENVAKAKLNALAAPYQVDGFGHVFENYPQGRTAGTLAEYRSALITQGSTEEYDEGRPGYWAQGQVAYLGPPTEILTQDLYDDAIRDLLMVTMEGVGTFAGVMGDIAIPLNDDSEVPGLRDFTNTGYLASLRGGYAGAFSDRVDVFSDYIMTLAKNDMSAEINRLAAPMLAGLEEQRAREVNRVSTQSAAANGFFSSGISYRVADINHRWMVLKAEKLAEITKDFRQQVYAVAAQVLGTLANWKNPAIEQSLELERFRLTSSMAMTQLNVANQVSISQMAMGAASYAKDEMNRILFNTKQVRDRYLTLDRWEAEYLSLLANVSGSGQSGSSGLLESITRTAMGGVQIATGIAAIAAGMPAGAAGIASGAETIGGIKGKT